MGLAMAKSETPARFISSEGVSFPNHKKIEPYVSEWKLIRLPGFVYFIFTYPVNALGVHFLIREPFKRISSLVTLHKPFMNLDHWRIEPPNCFFNTSRLYSSHSIDSGISIYRGIYGHTVGSKVYI